MTLTALFDLSLIGRRDRIALEWDREYTFGELDTRVCRMAHLLSARGLRAGDRLCIYLPNSLEFIELYLAATRLGIIFVPMNVLYRDREIGHIIRDAEPAAIITCEALRDYVAGDGPVWMIDELSRLALGQPPTRLASVTDADTPAAIVYTSGTTGTAKGAVLTQHNFVVNAINLVAIWQFTASDRLLLTLPLFHVHGLANGVHCWLLSGCRMKLTERFMHDQAAGWMRSFRPTVFFGVPTMYGRMLEWDAATATEIGQSVRLFVSGSAPLPAPVMEEFRRHYGHTILERYGMSETLMNLSNPYIGERRAGSVGLPLPGVRVRNLGPTGEPVADGETGELHLQGPNLFAGYWRRPDATQAAYRDGWFRTGDLATRSPDGYYTLQGRRTDLIISGGFNIYPREIEEFLAEQPGVVEVVVTGVSDERRGEVPVAYIVGDFDGPHLEAACRANLASFKIPRAFLRVPSLPRTALGKIQKHLLPAATF